MLDFLKIIRPNREFQHDDKYLFTLSHGVNKILDKLGEGEMGLNEIQSGYS